MISAPPVVPAQPNRATRRPPQRRRRQRAVRRLLLGSALAFLAATAVLLAYLASLPSVSDAEVRVQTLLTAHHGVDSGSPAPARVAEAAVAVEDRRFYLHHGLDSVGLARAAWDLVTTGSPHGGATITEQLAQALYEPNASGLMAHLAKAGLALKLEHRYTKAQILEMYLNAVYYGDGQWGIVQASRTYFGKDPNRLTWAEASMLAGLPNAPSAYDPARHYALARARERLVLIALVRYGTLTEKQAAAIDAQAPRLVAGVSRP